MSARATTPPTTAPLIVPALRGFAPEAVPAFGVGVMGTNEKEEEELVAEEVVLEPFDEAVPFAKAMYALHPM